MPITKVALITGTYFSQKTSDFFQRILSSSVPESFIKTYDMGEGVLQNYTSTGWPSEYLSQLMQHSLILRGHLTNPLNLPLSPQHILAQALGVHTVIRAFFAPEAFKKFLVISPPQEESFGPTPSFQMLSSGETSFHAALELAKAYGLSSIHCVETTPLSQPLLSYPHIKVTSLSSHEMIFKILHAPHAFQIIYTTHAYSQFISDLVQTVYEKLATSFIEISPSSTLFSFPTDRHHPSVIFSLSLLFRYLSYGKSAQFLEDYLEQSWDTLVKNALSSVILPSFSEPNDYRSAWQHLSCKYADLSFQNFSLLGFDCSIMPTSSLNDLGQGLEQLTASYPFYLQGIAYKNLQLYPLAPLIPCFDTPWCCRFLTRRGPLMMDSISSFLQRVASIYPWIHVGLLYEFEGKKNFCPFLPLM